ncbi:MAG TPA: thioredoxin-like domain-containing protein, partial [Verrucomicrobiae bacterium]|nr:thioredoxin-like domain-containing protein [Verrucomicrobiae bacterium]
MAGRHPEQHVRCPDFPPEFTWINTRCPLRVKEDLRGRVVILDFWTYCCINCAHILPVLKRVEARFEAAPFLVIGVHSAKFISEKDPENIRRAVERQEVTHPVVVDSEHDIWESFGVRAWPTLVIVDAEGYVRETLSGETREEPLAARVRELLDEGRVKGVLAASPLDVAPDPRDRSTFLRFPGRVLPAGSGLVVADSAHNRLVFADMEGSVRAVVGEGGAGARDGAAGHASFHNPQGLAAIGETLYVADTGNHLLRAVSLRTLEVTTVAGTGELGQGSPPRGPQGARRVPLRSPWGLLAVGERLLVSMAGSHQIWLHDPGESIAGAWAGSGVEDHVDGPLMQAAFAQPSGLAAAGRLILVADSETSSVRAIDIGDSRVRTIAGRGLFDFGDVDGPADEALFQHPLDVAAETGRLFVADTYNNKIRAIAFGTMETSTLFGDGDPKILSEPGGIAVVDGRIFIADTSNHRILEGDPASGELA